MHNNLKKLESLTKDVIEKDHVIDMVLAHLPSAAMIIGPNHLILYANKKAKDMGAIVGQKCFDSFAKKQFYTEGNMCCKFCEASNALETNTERKFTIKNKNGRTLEVHWISMVGTDRLLHYVYDVTDATNAPVVQ